MLRMVHPIYSESGTLFRDKFTWLLVLLHQPFALFDTDAFLRFRFLRCARKEVTIDAPARAAHLLYYRRIVDDVGFDSLTLIVSRLLLNPGPKRTLLGIEGRLPLQPLFMVVEEVLRDLVQFGRLALHLVFGLFGILPRALLLHFLQTVTIVHVFRKKMI